MKYKIFTYNIPGPEDPQDLNGFLSSHRILSVRSEVIEKNGTPYLVFIVEYMGSAPSQAKAPPRIDYREKLSESDFEKFSQLRDLRKAIAEKEGIPVYAVFTNAQLAAMVEARATEEAALSAIEGVGPSKLKKYSTPFLTLCRELFAHKEQVL